MVLGQRHHALAINNENFRKLENKLSNKACFFDFLHNKRLHDSILIFC